MSQDNDEWKSGGFSEVMKVKAFAKE